MKPTGIFVSYRRSDASAYAGRLYDALVRAFPRRTVFMDVDNIRPGEDFGEVLSDRVQDCGILLVVIGRGWTDTRSSSGARRLDEPGDYVRIEVATALSRAVTVIPILVDGATMPSPEELPDELKPLARRNAFAVTHNRFATDMSVLIGVLGRGGRPSSRARAAAAGVLTATVLTVAGGIGFWWWTESADIGPLRTAAGPALPAPAPVDTAAPAPTATPAPVAVPEAQVQPPPVAEPAPKPRIDRPSPAAPGGDVAPSVPPGRPENPRTATTAFVHQSYPADPDPGQRHWIRVAPDRWTERYPSGQTDYMNVVERTSLEDCAGTVVRKRDEPDFQLFIPDTDCRVMVLRWRRNRDPWHFLSRMTGVLPTPSRQSAR